MELFEGFHGFLVGCFGGLICFFTICFTSFDMFYIL